MDQAMTRVSGNGGAGGLQLKALIAAVAALLLLLLSASPALAQKRIALFLGNAAYQTVAKLPNPLKDATAMAALFKDAGFDQVILRQDLGGLEFKRALREFTTAAHDADVAIVYYAGHGIQVRDVNYMLPIDAKLANEIDIQDEAVSLERILAGLESVKRLRLVIIDACRENPFASRMKVADASRSIGRGLARIEPENNTLVAYAAKSGQIAQDGQGDHSPFTAALIKYLTVPGLDIRLSLGRVRDEVLKNTANRQEPFVYGSLGGDSIALVSGNEQASREAPGGVKADYQSAERIGTRRAWDAFLAAHEQGLYADLARAQLAKLIEAESGAIESTGSARPQASAPASVPPTTPAKQSGPSRDRAGNALDPRAAAETALMARLLPGLSPATPETATSPRIPANTPEQLLSAITELRRLGCPATQEDRKLGDAISQAITRYLSETGRSREDITVVERLIAEFRACRANCAQDNRQKSCTTSAEPGSPKKKASPRSPTLPSLRRRQAKSAREVPIRLPARPAAQQTSTGGAAFQAAPRGEIAPTPLPRASSQF
jgi:Caspase domain